LRYYGTMKKHLFSLSLVMLTSFGGTASASKPPACIANYVKATAPYGTATLNKLVFHVYDAQFWTDGKGWDKDAPYGLNLTYGVEIESKDFVERSLEELKHDPKVTQAMLAQFAKQLPPLMPNVAKGDSITAVSLPGGGAIFCHNGKPTGELKDAAMAQAFFGIWLGEHTSEPRLRNELLKL
jgi:hypothetical protein